MSMNRDGIAYADPAKVRVVAKALATKYGLGGDSDFEQHIYNRLMSQAEAKLIETDATARFNEASRPIRERASAAMDSLFKTDDIEAAKARQFARESSAALSSELRAEAAPITARFEQRATEQRASFAAIEQQYNTAVQAIQQQVDSGILAPERGQQALDEVAKNANASIDAGNERNAADYAQYQQAISSMNARYNRRFEEEQRRIMEGAKSRIRAAADRFQKEFDETPDGVKARQELYAAMNKAWRDAAAARGQEIGASASERFAVQSALNGPLAAMGARFIESATEGLGGAFKGIGMTLGNEILYGLGEEMQRVFVLPEAKSDNFSDLLDAANLSQSAGQLIGGMAPSAAASAAVAAATGGTGAPVAVSLLASGAAGWGVETIQIAGDTRDRVFRETGSREKADKAAHDAWVAQVQLAPAYAFEGMPFVGKVIDFIPSRLGRMGAAAGAEYGTELFQETLQSIAEENIMEGREPYADIGKMLADMSDSGELKKLLVTMAPISLLGAGGQVMGSPAKRLQDAATSYIAKNEVAKYADGATGQWMNAMMKAKGDDFAAAVIQGMLSGGQIDQATATRLLQMRDQVRTSRAEASRLRLRDSDTDAYVGLSLTRGALLQRVQQIPDGVEKTILTRRASEIEKSLTNFAIEGSRDYVTIKYPDGTGTLLDRAGAMRMLNSSSFVNEAARQGDGLTIDFQGDGMQDLVGDFQASVMAAQEAMDARYEAAGRLATEPASLTPQATRGGPTQTVRAIGDTEVTNGAVSGVLIKGGSGWSSPNITIDGLSPEDAARKQEAARIQKAFDKAKIKSEVTNTPMPEGATRPKDFEIKVNAPIEDVPGATPIHKGVISPYETVTPRTSPIAEPVAPVSGSTPSTTDIGQGNGAESLTSASLQEKFGYTPEVADATIAIADAMGLDKSKIFVEKGGAPAKDALTQRPALTQNEIADREEIMPTDQLRGAIEAFVGGEPSTIDQAVRDITDHIQQARKEISVTNVKGVLDRALLAAREVWADVQGEPMSQTEAEGYKETIRALKEMASNPNDSEVRAIVRTLAPRTNRGERVVDYSPDTDKNTLYQKDEAFDGIEIPKTPIGDTKTVTVDGKERTVLNSEGKPIHPTVEGVRNFWKWFGDSKVVDEQGRPLVVYHGTRADFDVFDASKARRTGYSRLGFWFSDNQGAARQYGTSVIPAYLSISKPRTLREWDDLVMEEDTAHRVRRDLKIDEGHIALRDDLSKRNNDGLRIGPVEIDDVPSQVIFVALDPTQIKSATGNYGAFDPKNPSILQQNEKGSVEFKEGGEAIIRALKNPDASTGVHELAHVARRFLFDKNIPQINRQGISDEHIGVAEEWAGAKDGVWSREAEEKFARGFERYLSDGFAPNNDLRSVFAKFAQWMSDIYNKLLGSPIDIKVSPAMQEVFDALVSRGPKEAKTNEKSEPKAHEGSETKKEEEDEDEDEDEDEEKPGLTKEEVNIRAAAKRIKKQYPELYKAMDRRDGKRGILYHKLPNSTSIEAVRELVVWMGVDAATDAMTDPSNGLPNAFRVFMGRMIVKQYLDEGKMDKAAEAAEDLLTMGTEMGQGIQAFRDMPEALSPELILYREQKKMKERRSDLEARANRNGDITKMKKVLRKIDESIERVLSGAGVQTKVIHAAVPIKGAKMPGINKDRIKKALNWDSNKIVTKARRNEIRKALQGTFNSNLSPLQVELAAGYIEAGARTFAAIADEVAKEFGRKAVPYFKEAYKEAFNYLKKRGLDVGEPEGDKEIDRVISEANTTIAVEELKKAIAKGDNKRATELVAQIQSSAKDYNVWGVYQKYAAERIKRMAETSIRSDMAERDELRDFANALVRNITAQLREEAKSKGKELSKRDEQRSDIEVIGDAYKNFDRYKDAWTEAQNQLKAKARAANARLEKAETPEAKEEARTALAREEAKLAKLDEYFGDLLLKPFSSEGMGRAVKQGLKDLDIRIKDIIRKHYTDQFASKMLLVDRLMTEAGLEGEEAIALAKEVKRQFDAITEAAKKEAIAKHVPKKGRDSTVEAVLALTNMGAFTDDDFIKAYSEAMGWPSLTAKNIQRLHELSNAIQEAPPGRPRLEATQDLLSYQENISGISKFELAQHIWYANVLSGPITQVVNLVANATQTAMELGVAISRNPSRVPIIADAVAYGFKRGAHEAMSTLRTGYSPMKDNKASLLPTGERHDFGKSLRASDKALAQQFGKVVGLLNGAKFVTRAMTAADVLFFEANRELRAQQWAIRMAKDSNPSEKVRNEALKILRRDEAAEVLSQWQAGREYAIEKESINASDLTAAQKKTALKKAERDYKRRKFELAERGRDEAIRDESARFASRVTYNYAPEGLLGAFANTMNAVNKSIPGASFLVPFVNIVANVANESINYTPYGFVRGVAGGSTLTEFNDKMGIKAPLSALRKKDLTPEQRADIRADLYRKATMGMAFATLVAMMSDPEDEDKWWYMQVTGSGKGTYQANEAMRDKGWRPYSIKIGDTWISYQYTPLVFVLSFVGHYRDIEKYREQKIDETEWDRLSMSLGRASASFMDMSFLSTIGNVFDSFSRGDGFGDAISKELTRIGKGFVIPSAYTQLAREMEWAMGIPMKETRKDPYGYMVQDIPFLRDRLNVKRNFLGEPIVPEEMFLSRFIATQKHDAVADVINQFGWSPHTPAPRSISGMDKDTGEERMFTQQEEDVFFQERGAYMRKYIEKKHDRLMKMDKKNFISEMGSMVSDATERAKAKAVGWDVSTPEWMK